MGRHEVRAAAVQWRFRPVADVDELATSFDLLVGRAAGEGATLVALPPLACLALVEGPHPTWWKAGAPAPLGDLRAAAEAWAGISRDLAARHRVFLVAGSCLEPAADGSLRHRADVWGPRGDLRGTACQTHPSPQERAWGVAPAEVVEPIAAAGCRLGLLIGDDVRYPEVSRILTLQGANVLVHLWAGGYRNQAEWSGRLWREVQANQVRGGGGPDRRPIGVRPARTGGGAGPPGARCAAQRWHPGCEPGPGGSGRGGHAGLWGPSGDG